MWLYCGGAGQACRKARPYNANSRDILLGWGEKRLMSLSLANLFPPRKNHRIAFLRPFKCRGGVSQACNGCQKKKFSDLLVPTLDPISSLVRSFHWSFWRKRQIRFPESVIQGPSPRLAHVIFVLSINQ